MPNLSLRSRILLGMASVALVATLGMGFGVGVFVEEFAERTVVERLDKAHRSFQRYLDSRYRLLENFVTQVAQTPVIKATLQIDEIDHHTARELVTQTLGDLRVDFMVLVDADGKILADTTTQTGETPLPMDSTAVRRALEGESFSGIRDDSRDVYMIASGPVTLGPQLLGAIVIGERISKAIATEFGEAVDADVLLLRAGQPLQWSAPRDDSEVSVYDPNEIAIAVATATEHAGQARRSRLASGDRFIAEQDLGERSCLVLSRSVDDLMQLQSYLFQVVALLGLFAAGAAMAFGHWIARRLTSPISELVAATEKIADGKLHTSVRETGMEEMARLGQAFNHMTRQVRQLLEDAVQKAELLSRQKNELQWANQVKSNFLVTASHELRTPLTNIASSTEILLHHGGGEDPQTSTEFLSVIEMEGARLIRLIDQLMELTKLEAGDAECHEEPYELADAVEAAATKFREEHPARGRTLRLPTRASGLSILGDSERLRQILEQLFDNAAKFTAADSPIEIEIYELTETVELRVVDHGPGIADARDKERIFERFVQFGDLLTGKPAGVGLGLPICREIATAMGGTLICEDNPGGGAVFVLSLTAAPTPTPPRSSATV